MYKSKECIEIYDAPKIEGSKDLFNFKSDFRYKKYMGRIGSWEERCIISHVLATNLSLIKCFNQLFYLLCFNQETVMPVERINLLVLSIWHLSSEVFLF